MTEETKKAFNRAMVVLIGSAKPDSFGGLVAMLEKDMGQKAVSQILDISVLELLQNLSLRDLGMLAEGK